MSVRQSKPHSPMKIVRFIFALCIVGLLGGCLVGPSFPNIVIVTGEPSPGDADYARALAARLTRERPGAERGPAMTSTAPIPKN